MDIILWLIFGAVAGWLAGILYKGYGFGLLGNMVVGILGAVIGGKLFQLLGIGASGSMIGSMITAVFGAIVLLFVIGLVKKS